MICLRPPASASRNVVKLMHLPALFLALTEPQLPRRSDLETWLSISAGSEAGWDRCLGHSQLLVAPVGQQSSQEAGTITASTKHGR